MKVYLDINGWRKEIDVSPECIDRGFIKYQSPFQSAQAKVYEVGAEKITNEKITEYRFYLTRYSDEGKPIFECDLS